MYIIYIVYKVINPKSVEWFCWDVLVSGCEILTHLSVFYVSPVLYLDGQMPCEVQAVITVKLKDIRALKSKPARLLLTTRPSGHNVRSTWACASHVGPPVDTYCYPGIDEVTLFHCSSSFITHQ